MSDMNGAPGSDARWQVDVRDVMAGGGVLLVLGGAWVIHPGLVIIALGCALAGAAWYFAKRKG
jgi:hypothetical protein